MVAERDDEDLTPAAVLRFGQRNFLYLAFVTLLGPLALALDGPRSGAHGGTVVAFMLCVGGSAGFFVINAGLTVFDAAARRPGRKALTGCGLALVAGGMTLLLLRPYGV